MEDFEFYYAIKFNDEKFKFYSEKLSNYVIDCRFD